MPTLSELKKRLRSIETTLQISGAMKTVSAAKYSKINSVLSGYKPYADECKAILDRYGKFASDLIPETRGGRDLYIILSSNRGLCGGYNSVLFDFADSLLAAVGQNASVAVGGAVAAEKYSEISVKTFSVSDIPDFESASEIVSYITEEYKSGRVSSVSFIYESFKNMMTQEPICRKLLPFSADGEAEDDGVLFVPDKETVLSVALMHCISSSVYSILLEAMAGAQAATLMTMRSAYDNASETAEKLRGQISRQRQKQVTMSVIETASGNRGNET